MVYINSSLDNVDFSLIERVEIYPCSTGYFNLICLTNGHEAISDSYPCIEDAMVFKEMVERWKKQHQH